MQHLKNGSFGTKGRISKPNLLQKTRPKNKPTGEKHEHRFVEYVRRCLEIVVTLGGLYGFAYALYDLSYQTGASITYPASDPNDPFVFPFSIKNESHAFGLYRLTWYCYMIRMELPNMPPLTKTATLKWSSSVIEPGKSVNVLCDDFRVRTKVLYANLAIDLEYTVYFFGIIPVRRHPVQNFTWYYQASNPQWISGELVAP